MNPDTAFLIAIIGSLVWLAFCITEGIYRIFKYFRDKHHADLNAEDWFKMLEKRRKK